MILSLNKLKKCRESIRDYLIALAESNEAEAGYWKQQISPTFIAFANRSVLDILESFENDHHANPKLATANTLIKLLNNLPVRDDDNAATLQRILQRPGTVIPNNPKGPTNKIIIANHNATDLITTLVKISMLGYLCEHCATIRNQAIPPFTMAWLDDEVNKCEQKADQPHQYCPFYTPFNFEELDRAFTAMDLAVNRTIEQSQQLGNQAHCEIQKQARENRKKQQQAMLKQRKKREKRQHHEKTQRIEAKRFKRKKFKDNKKLAFPEVIAVPEIVEKKSYAALKICGYAISTVASYFAIVGGLIPSLLAFNIAVQIAFSAVMPLTGFLSFKLFSASLGFFKKIMFGIPRAPAILENREFQLNYLINDDVVEIGQHKVYSPQRLAKWQQTDKGHDQRHARSGKYKRLALK